MTLCNEKHMCVGDRKPSGLLERRRPHMSSFFLVCSRSLQPKEHAVMDFIPSQEDRDLGERLAKAIHYKAVTVTDLGGGKIGYAVWVGNPEIKSAAPLGRLDFVKRADGTFSVK